MKILRSLPGIIEIEEICRNPDNLKRDEVRNENLEKINRVSAKFFGIIAYDTYGHWPEDGEPDRECSRFQEAEQHYEVCDWEYLGDAITVWNMLGWDLANTKGEELFCAPYFNRQIIAVEKQLVEGAKFHPLGNGIRPDFLKSDKEKRLEAYLLEDQLEKEAKNFRRTYGLQ